jgi:hypothetical protein
MDYREMLQTLYDASYQCSYCNNRIYPIIDSISLRGDGEISVSNESTEITGYGGRVLKKDVCNTCRDAAHSLAVEQSKMIMMNLCKERLVT